MCRPLDRTRFPLTLAAGLRNMFDHIVSTPLPRHLADLVRRLSTDWDKRHGKQSRTVSAPGTRVPDGGEGPSTRQ
jgi:hypothetical protein